MIELQALTAYPPRVPSARVRLAAFAPFLAQQGVALHYRPSFSDPEYALLASGASAPRKALAVASGTLRAARQLAAARRASDRGDALLLVHRLLAPTPLPGIDPPHRLDVYDFDDALFVGSVADVNQRFDWLKQEARRARAATARARLVLAGNAYLAAQAAPLNVHVEVLPSCVDPSSQPLHVHRPAETVVIGWVGSSSTVPYLRPVLPVLERLHGLVPGVRLLVIGADCGLRADWVAHRPWALDRVPGDLASIDVGLMPLPDDPWTRGKSGYKLLQYFAAGVPAVGSPVGVNATLLDGRRGIAAGDEREWLAALRTLVSDPAERTERGALARSYVEAGYSYQHWAPELARLLRELS